MFPSGCGRSPGKIKTKFSIYAYCSVENVNFAVNTENEMILSNTVEYLREARSKYESYDNEWEKVNFDEVSGGYNVYHIKHQFTSIEGGAEGEKTVGNMLAKLGKQVEFLPEGGKKSPDIKFDNQTWDIKYIDMANEETIRKYIKDARKADNGIFYWGSKSDKLEMLIRAIGRTEGYFNKKNELHTMPNIYYMDNGRLKLLWSKKCKKIKKKGHFHVPIL